MRPGVVHRLQQLVEAQADNSQLRVFEICLTLNVSYGALRLACVRHLGTSPKQYLLQRQMRLVRCALQQGNCETTSVTRIATQYGFFELGRFAVNYRKMFGESPSATLRGILVSTTLPPSKKRYSSVSDLVEIAKLRRRADFCCRQAQILIKQLHLNLETAQETISRFHRLRYEISLLRSVSRAHSARPLNVATMKTHGRKLEITAARDH